MRKLLILFFVVVVLGSTFFCFPLALAAENEEVEQRDGQYEVTFERTDWTSLTNTDHNPLGTYSGKYENISVGLHSDGLQISTQVLSPFLISVGYSSGKMQWGNDIEFAVGSSENDLPAGFLSIVEPNKEYTINGTYSLFVWNQASFEFPFQMIISYTDIDDTTITLNYKIVYSYVYMQQFAQYGVALPEDLAFKITGLESTFVTFNYINADFGITNLNRGYNIGSTFGRLPEIPVPNYVISYYWAYEGALNVPLTINSVVENKSIYAVYTVNMSILSNTAQSLLQSYYSQGYAAGVAEDTPTSALGGIVQGVSSMLNIPLFGNFTLGGLIAIILGLSLLFLFLKIFAGG